MSHSVFAQAKKSLVCYLTAFYPDREKFLTYSKACLDGGADVLEVGHPFSDPIADGPIITKAMTKALEFEPECQETMGLIAELKKTHKKPMIYFGYINPALQMGMDDFSKNLKECGAEGALFVDLPYENRDWVEVSLGENGLSRISLLAPTTSEERQKNILKFAQGFLYIVSYSGVTGEKSAVSSDLPQRLKALREIRDDLPFLWVLGSELLKMLQH